MIQQVVRFEGTIAAKPRGSSLKTPKSYFILRTTLKLALGILQVAVSFLLRAPSIVVS